MPFPLLRIPSRVVQQLQRVVPQLLALCLGVASVVLIGRVALDQRFESWLMLASSRWQPVTASPLTLVALDEAAIDTLGAWPWPRERWAELLNRLHDQHKPALVALDAVFPPAPEQGAGNQAFGQALARGPAVIGQLLLPESGQRGLARWAEMADGDLPVAGALAMQGILANDPAVAAHAQVGHINALIDPDGAMRYAPSLLCLPRPETACSLSFAQAMINALTGITQWEWRRGQWNEAEWLVYPEGLASLALPLDEALRVRIPWRRPSAFSYISATDIWFGRLPPGTLDQHVLVFGGVSLGLGDLATSPLQTTVPGLEVHTQILRNWFEGALPYQPRYAAALVWLWALLLVGIILQGAAHARRVLLATVLGMSLPIASALALWLASRTIWPVLPSVVLIGVTGVALLITRALRDRGRLLDRLEAYLPSPLRRLLGRSGEGIPTETGWGTVMVADILGYTRQSLRLSLAELAYWCDTGINLVIDHAQAQGAMLDNVAGDGALLLWRTGTDAQQAAAVARTMQQVLEDLPRVNAELAERRLPPLSIGMGTHAGPYLLGSFGERRKRYTVISEVANLAAHIERQTRRHPWPTLLSQTVAQSLPSRMTRPVGDMDLGNGRKLALFTLAGVPDNQWPGADLPPPAANVPPSSSGSSAAATPPLGLSRVAGRWCVLAVCALLSFVLSTTPLRAQSPPVASLSIKATLQQAARQAYERGLDARARRDFTEAAMLFEQALLMDPDFAGAWFDYGITLCDVGDPAGCRNILQQAVMQFGMPPGLQPLLADALDLHQGELQVGLGASTNMLRAANNSSLTLMLDGTAVEAVIDERYRKRGGGYVDALFGWQTQWPLENVKARLVLSSRRPLAADLPRFLAGYAEVGMGWRPRTQIGVLLHGVDEDYLGAVYGAGVWVEHQFRPQGWSIRASVENRRPRGLSSWITPRLQVQVPLVGETSLALGWETDSPRDDRAGQGQTRWTLDLRSHVSLPAVAGRTPRLILGAGVMQANDRAIYSPLFGDVINRRLRLQASADLAVNLDRNWRVTFGVAGTRQRARIALFDYSEWRASLSLGYVFN